MLGRDEFINLAPVTVIDCSRQVEELKGGTIDIKLEFDSHKPFADDTCAYAVIIHDRLIQYNPFSNIVRKVL